MTYKIFKQILRHKLITGIILLLVIAGGYFGYQNLIKDKNLVRYVMAAVEKGTIIISVSGSGQVSALNEVDIKSKVSGDVVYIGVENGQEVKTGTLISQIGTSDVQQTVRDAETNLQLAKIELEKMKGSDVFRGAKEKAISDLEKAYEDGFGTVVDAFSDLPNTMSGLETIILGNTFGSFAQANIDYYTNYLKVYNDKAMGYGNNAYNAYQLAKTSYDKNLNDYKNANRFSDEETIESLIDETYEIAEDIAGAIQNINILLQSFKEELVEQKLTPNALFNTYLSNINTYTSETNNHLSSLSSAKDNIQTKKEAITDADFDISSQEIKVSQAEDALQDAEEKLDYCSIRAPFDGIITNIDIEKEDSVSSATIVATLITKQKIAEISLNEVDVAKVKVGQKATLTFDALPEMNISGKVLEVDTVGTVTQGVVNYGVKIGFDTEVDQIKPGMSVTADIITESKQDVLVLPNSAVKSQGNSYYVELVEASEEMKQQLLASVSGAVLPKPPGVQSIEIGLSNDLSTEIVSGLKEGDIVVTSTISPTTSNGQTNQTQTTQGFQIPGISSQGTSQLRNFRAGD